MADPPWEFCCGKLIAPVIRRIFFTCVALESIICPKPKSRKQEIVCDFFCLPRSFVFTSLFFCDCHCFGDCGFEFILMYVFRAFLSRLSCGGTVFFCKTIDIDFAAPVW